MNERLKGSGGCRTSQSGDSAQPAAKTSCSFYIWDDVAYWIGICLSKGIPWVGIVFIAREIRLAVSALAGQQTDANIIMKLMAEMRADQYIAYIFGAVGVGYGALEHRLRKKKEARMGHRLKELEEKLDPKRTSSTNDE